MLPKLRKKRKLGKIIQRFLSYKIEKRSDLFKEVCFQEIPVTLKSDLDWYGKIIPKGATGTIKAVDPIEGVLLVDLEINGCAFRVTDFLEDIVEHLSFENKEDRKYIKETVKNIPWTTVVYG